MLLTDILTTKENKSGGILITIAPDFVQAVQADRRSFFSDKTLSHGTALDLFCSWFEFWGIPLVRRAGTETAFERSFCVATWPEVMPENSHGPQLIPKIAEHASELNAVFAERKPKLVIFLSCYLWQAMNVAKGVFSQTAGIPLEAGRRLTDKRLAAYAQRWSTLMTVALPLPGKNTTKEYVCSLAGGMQSVFRETALLPKSSSDPLLVAAAKMLVFDRTTSIDSIRVHLHVDKKRAESLFDALENRVYRLDEAGHPRAIGKQTD